MTPVYLSDAQLGAWLLLTGVLFSLACDTVMVPEGGGVGTAVCDPARCGWHWADVRAVAAELRRFEVPQRNALEVVWVVSGTGAVSGIRHRMGANRALAETLERGRRPAETFGDGSRGGVQKESTHPRNGVVVNVVTATDPMVISAVIVLASLVLSLTALGVNRSSVRRSMDLSPISTRTPRSDCPVPSCTIVHPPRGRHRADPRPDGPVTIIVAAFATGFGLISGSKGQHLDHFGR